ncbi:MAG: ABC transporter permease [Schwartzia sp.]|nr:ABC transporter permease [Schwartzia sp. (in: firmicutes)]
MLALWERELSLLLAERKLVAVVLLFAATAYAFLIGNLYNGHVVEHIPVVVCDLDGSAESRAFCREIRTVHTYDVTLVTGKLDEAETALAQRDAAAVIVIPENFAKDLSERRSVQLPFITDGSNSLVQSYSLAPIQELVGAFSAAQTARTAAADGMPELPVTPVSVSLRVPENPTGSYAFFYLYGVMLTAAQIGVMLSTALSVWGDARKPLFAENGVWKTLLAKQSFYGAASVLSMLIGLSVLVLVFRMPFKGSLFVFLPLYAAYAFAAMNLATAFALYFRTELALVQCLVFYALPAFLLSGYIWPEHGMLPMFRWISATFPLHYLLVDFRAVALSGVPFSGLLPDAVALLAMGVVLLLVNGSVLKKRAASFGLLPAN